MATEKDTPPATRSNGERFAPFHNTADALDWDGRLGDLADQRVIAVDTQADPAALACLVNGRALGLQRLIDFAASSRSDDADPAQLAEIVAPLVSEIAQLSEVLRDRLLNDSCAAR